MSGPFPLVPLGEVAKQRKHFIEIDDLESYKRCRVQLHAQGIVLRDIAVGAEIKTKRQQLCQPGDFLVAEIDAKVGGFGIVPGSLEGAIVSSHYFLFDVDQDKLDIRFLDYWIRTPGFRDQVSAQGSTNYAAIRSSDVLGYTVPLPALAEQQRIVPQIEALAAKIAEAQGLRREAVADVNALVAAERARIFGELASGVNKPLVDISILERGRFSHRPRNDPSFFGGEHPWIQIGQIEGPDKYIRCWTETLNDSGLAVSRKFPKGTLLVSIAATIGAVGILDFDCCIPDSVVAVTSKNGMDIEYIYHYFRYVRTELETGASQSAQKNINLQVLSKMPVPHVPFDEQRRIVEYLDRLQAQADAVKRL